MVVEKSSVRFTGRPVDKRDHWCAREGYADKDKGSVSRKLSRSCASVVTGNAKAFDAIYIQSMRALYVIQIKTLG
jgi:hypothetical protein